MSLKFGTKADNLYNLSTILRCGEVLPMVRFSVAEWQDQGMQLLDINSFNWLSRKLIVRSSGIDEDNLNQSLAGKFKSTKNVIGSKNIETAIEGVIASFGEYKSPLNQIFVQPMIETPLASGVAFTRDPSTGGHYYVLNIDDTSGKTDTVTSGLTNHLKTIFIDKFEPKPDDDLVSSLIKLLRELEDLYQEDSLDVEFALSLDGQLILLQVRPLLSPKKKKFTLERQNQVLTEIQQNISNLNQPHPHLFGNKTVFGLMPDWNPGEIVGQRPRPLALSLYRELITDHIWAYQRGNYGYRNLRSFPLLVDFYGLPYIDVRVSFNSFIPENVSDALAEKLVNHYIQQLCDVPSLHDKVEFKILHSCFTLDIDHRLEPLLKFGFERKELDDIKIALRNLTNTITHGQNGLWRKDIKKIDKLKDRQNQILRSDLNELGKIYWLIEDCKRYGTLPFAGLARAGFIAVQMLHSLVNTGILTKYELEQFMSGLKTVSSIMTADFDILTKENFIEKYGHLRPGTYDILSPTYSEEPESYFDWDKCGGNLLSNTPTKINFEVSPSQHNQLQSALEENGLEHEVLSFFDFITGAIEGREYAKFVFTKSLSYAMDHIVSMGEQSGFNRDDLSYLNITSILSLYSSSNDVRDLLQRVIDDGKSRYEITKMVSMPPLIVDEENIRNFILPVDEPNFVTLRSCIGFVVNKKSLHSKLHGNIIMIESADPGYDWIFSHAIAGFITMYGGMNSHMAIRAAELEIPAVIGSGETLFNKWKDAISLEINCSSKYVKVLR